MAGTITHEWNGTILTITSDSGTSSADLKGDKGDKGCRGPQGRAGVILNEDGTVDMTGYATETYVDEKLTDVNATVDLSNYYTKTEVDTKIVGVNEKFNSYCTKAEIAESMVEIDALLTDFETNEYVTQAYLGSNYYTKFETRDTISAYLESYYTKEEINDKGYQTEEQVNALITAALAAIGTAEGGAY